MSYFIFAFTLLSYESFIIYLGQVMPPLRFASRNLFFLDLIGLSVNLSYQMMFFLGIGTLVLLWLNSRLIFKKYYSLIPPIIYAISPWSSYLVFAGSFYILLLFLSLFLFYGLLLTKTGKTLIGLILMVTAGSILMYSSFIFFILLPIIFALIIIFRIIPSNTFRIPLLILFFVALPLFYMIYNNQVGFRNISKNETKILSDPGLLNSVNKYQGAAQKTGYGKIAKISENKYVFTLEYIFLKYAKQIIPSSYLTQQEKLLNFSFSPPIYFGFLIPLLYGLYKIFQSSVLRKNLLLSTMLVIPSVLSEQMVDLNRLIVFAPVVILIISYGLIKLGEQRKKAPFFLMLALILVIFQLLTTFSDISIREKDRYTKYFGRNYEIGKQ